MKNEIGKTSRSIAFKQWCHERNYVPLETEYRYANAPMRYLCTCGAKRAISWKRMVRGETGCKPCSAIRGAAKKKYTMEQARERFLKKKLKLMESVYVGGNARMSYVCTVCQTPGQMRLATVNRGHGCKTCAERIKAAARRVSMEEVRDYFEASGLELLEGGYKNNSTAMRCRCIICGQEARMQLRTVRRGGICRKCALERRSGPGHHRWIADRDEAKLRQKIIEKCHDSKKHCLMYIDREAPDTISEELGYSPLQLRHHLESFPDWPRLIRGEWHLDHIYPIVAFIEYGITDVRVINALDNLQPLDARSNLSKAGSYDREKFDAYLVTKGILPGSTD